MRYSKHTLGQHNTKDFSSSWQYKEGVFKTKTGKYICRVRIKSKGFSTISQHETKEEAQKAYDEYYETN